MESVLQLRTNIVMSFLVRSVSRGQKYLHQVARQAAMPPTKQPSSAPWYIVDRYRKNGGVASSVAFCGFSRKGSIYLAYQFWSRRPRRPTKSHPLSEGGRRGREGTDCLRAITFLAAALISIQEDEMGHGSKRGGYQADSKQHVSC